MKLVYPALFTPSEESEGYLVIVPALPGCVTEGNSVIDSIEKGTDAACRWVLEALEKGQNIPTFSPIRVQDTESFVNLLVLDMDTYAEQYGSHCVRKNITLPAWLNAYGEKNNINFSRVLQDALLNMAQS